MALTPVLRQLVPLFVLLAVFQRLVVAEPIPLALPEARPLPTANPEPEPVPGPIPEAIAEAEAEADPNAQTYNYAPFSGAVYVVNADGSGFTQASPAICPNQAPQGCGNINVWNWCCPQSNTCAWMPNQVVGCCPNGSGCQGTVNAAVIQTVTITQYMNVQQTTTTYVNNNPTVVVGVQGTTQTNSNTIVYNGYCSTMVADGPNLPTTAAGQCGTILVIAGAGVRSVGWRLPAFVLGFYTVLGGLGFWGFRRRI